MIETGIYLSENEKEEIIRAYEERVSFAKTYEDEEELELINDENIIRSIEVLKQENKLSLNLILSDLFRTEEISINEETLENLIQGMNSEDKDFIKRRFDEEGNKISVNRIKQLFLDSELKKSLKLTLSPNLVRNYKRVIESFTKIKFKGNKEEVLERLMNGTIQYEDMEKLMELLSKGDMLRNENFIELFEDGRIDVSQLGEKFWEEIEEGYNAKQRAIYEKALENISVFDTSELTKVQAEVIKELQEKIADNPTKIEQMQEIVDKFNGIVEESWKDYIEKGEGLLVHATTSPLIENNGNSLSTSLYIPDALTETFLNLQQAFIVKPNKIEIALSNNMYSNLERLRTDILLETPKQVKQKRLGEQFKDEYTSEIIVSDFEIVGFLALEEISEERKEELVKNGIPIKVIKDGKLEDLETENKPKDILEEIETQKLQEQHQPEKEQYRQESFKDEIEDEFKKKEEESQESKRTVDSGISMFEKWYNSIDKVPKNVKNEFLKMRSDIVKFIGEKIMKRNKIQEIKKDEEQMEGR